MKNKYLFGAVGAINVAPSPELFVGGRPADGEPVDIPGYQLMVDDENKPVLADNGKFQYTRVDENAATPPPILTPPIKKTTGSGGGGDDLKNQRDYELYLNMSKSLTLQLPFERDRVIASKWVKKIQTSEVELVKKLNYVKLLCITTLQHRLAGPFKSIPKPGPELDDLGDMTMEELINVMANESVSINSPYYVELSGDLKEYAAYQEIPDFGAHFYYAFSNETILNWHNEKRAIVPAGSINYPILNPPHKHITKTSEAFKEAYANYAKPKPRSTITPDLLPTLVPELHKRKVVMKEEITRMGTKKLISEHCKCPPEAKPDLIGPDWLHEPDGTKCTKPSRADIGRPAFCIAKKAEACAAAAKEAAIAAEKAAAAAAAEKAAAAKKT